MTKLQIDAEIVFTGYNTNRKKKLGVNAKKALDIMAKYRDIENRNKLIRKVKDGI